MLEAASMAVTRRVALGARAARRRRARAAEDHRDRHRRHRRRLLSARRRPRQRAVEEPAGHAGDRGGHRRLGRQSQADRLRPERARLHRWPTPRSTRSRARTSSRAAKVPLRTLMVLYPNRMHVVTIEGTGIEKMADLKGKRVSTGSPRQRHRGDGVPRHRGRRPRQGQGHEARAARRRRIGQRHQGPQDRRVLLGRRPADRGGDRSRRHARRQDQADRSRRPRRQDERQIRQALRRRTSITARTYPGQDKDNKIATVWNILVTNDKMTDEVAYNIVKTDLRQEGRPRRRAQGGQELHAREPGQGQLAGPVASRRGEILQGEGRQGVAISPLPSP